MKNRTKLKCSLCQATADLNDSPKAWNGWQLVPKHVCPKCIYEALVLKGFEIVRSQVNGKRIETLVFRGNNA